MPMRCFANYFAPAPISRTAAVLAASLVLGALFSFAPRAGAVRCAVPELEQYKSLIRPVETMERTHRSGDLRTPPANPQVGDAWYWYCWNLSGMPVGELKLCTVRGKGDHCYVVIENSQWGTRVNQTDIDAIVAAWDSTSQGPWPDHGIHQLDTENFGPIPDELDHDPRVYILYYAFTVSADGFFWSFDEYPDGSQSFASNECEVLYMNSAQFDPGGSYLISVQAHELQHMIHWLADEDESTWVNEGMSELAMWFYGHPDQVIQFPAAPDNNLTVWNSVFADYVKVYLWGLYFYEHFGGQATILNLVSQPGNSTAGVQAAMTAMGYATSFAQMVADWTTANYLDDPSIAGGKYNYAGEDIPAFAAVTKSTYPVPSTNATVNHFAADYIKFINGQPQQLNFNGGDTADWSARVIKYLAGTPLSVEDVTLNAADDGSLVLSEFGTAYDQVVLVAANISVGGGTSYQYGTEGTTAVEDPGALATGMRLVGVGPNPFRGETAMRLSLPRPGPVSATVHDAAGALVRVLEAGSTAGGERLIRWDGRDGSGAAVPSGAYFVRVATADGQALSHRLTVIR